MAGNRPLESRNPSDQGVDSVAAVTTIGDLQLEQADVERLDTAHESAEQFETREVESDDSTRIEPLDAENQTDEADDQDRDEAERRDSELSRVQAVGRTATARPLIERRPSTDGDGSKTDKSGDVYIQAKTPKRYAQDVSDQTRREGLGYYAANEKPISRDDGRGAVSAAAVYADRVSKLEQQGVKHGRGVCEVDADTGLRTRDLLSALQRDHLDVYEHPDFKAVVMSPNAKEIQQSDIFAPFGNKVEVRESSLDEAPVIPEGTLFAMFTGTEHAPVHRLSKPQDGSGKVVEVQSKTLLRGGDPIITANTSPDGATTVESVRAGRLFTFGTADSQEARDAYAAKIGPRVFEQVHAAKSKDDTDASESSWLGSLARQDENARAFMDGWPENIAHMRHHSPELEARTASIVAGLDRNGLVMVDGPIRDGDQPVNWKDLSRLEGLLVSNVAEGDTFRRGAAAAGKSADFYIPERPPKDEGKYTLGLLDLTSDDAVRSSSEDVLKRIVGANGNLPQDILQNARTALGAERNGRRSGGASAVADIVSQYEAYVDSGGMTLDPELAKKLKESGTHGHALPELDADLARGLAKTLREHGHYEDAVRFAQKAITAAPHVDAEARVEKAKALIMISELAGTDAEIEAVLAGTEERREEALHEITNKQAAAFVAAAAELAMAREISPHFVGLHKAQAQLAMTAGRWDKYSDALKAILQDAPEIRDPRHDPSSDPSLRSLRDYINPETGKPVLGQAAEAAAVAKLLTSMLRAEGWAADRADERAKPEWVRTERVGRDEHGTWEVDARYDLVRPGALVRERIAATAPLIASTLHGRLHDIAPDRRQWQDAELKPLMDIVESYLPVGGTVSQIRQDSLRLTGEVALAAAAFDKQRRGGATVGELVPYKGAEHDGYKPEWVSFPWAVLKWDTKQPISSLELFFTNTPEHRADLGQPVILQGESGAGKSTLAQNLIRATVQEGGLKAWIWDVGERPQHRNIGRVLGEDTQVTHIRFGNPEFPLAALGLMEPEPGFPMQQHLRLAMMALLFATSAEEPFPQLTGAAAQKLMNKLGHDVRDDTGKFNPNTVDSEEASLADFGEYVDEVLGHTQIYGEGGDVQKNVKGFLMARLNELQSGVIGPHISSQNALDIADLCDNHQVVHVDFSDIANPKDRKFAMALLYMKRMEHDIMRRAAAGDEDLPLDSVDWIEEAQSVFGSEHAPDSPDAQLAKFFSSIARQTRGYGRGTVPIVQSAEQLSSDMRDNAATLFVGLTPSETTRRVLLGGVGIKDDSDRFDDVAKLPQGYFLVAKTGIPDPLLVHLPKPELRTPAEQRPFKVRHGYYTPDGQPPTPNEINKAETELLRSDWLTIYTAVDTLARITGSPLPAVPAEMQRQLDSVPERQRELMLQIAARQQVAARSSVVRPHYNTARLEQVVANDAAMSLGGVPIAGHNPGTGLVVPELAVAGLAQALERPYADTPPDPSTHVPYPTVNIPGLDDAIAAQQTRQDRQRPGMADRSFGMPRASEVREALTRIPAAVEGEKGRVAANQAAALRAILGSDNGASLYAAMQRVTGFEPNQMKQWLAVSKELGLWKDGDPTLPWFASYMSTIEKTIWAAKAQARQAVRSSTTAQAEPAVIPQRSTRQPAPAPQRHASAADEAASRTPNSAREAALEEAGALLDQFSNGDNHTMAVNMAVQAYLLRNQSDPALVARMNADPKLTEKIVRAAQSNYALNGRKGLIDTLRQIIE